MRSPDSDLARCPTYLYGTVDGAIGLVVSLPPSAFAALAKLQAAMAKAVRGVGGFRHDAWRAFCDERRSEPARGFVDGDLVEQYLDLPREAAEAVAAEVGLPADELARRVEELARLH